MENKVRDRNIWPGLGGVSRSRTDKVEVTIDVRVGDAVISDSFLGRYTAGAVESRYKTRGGRKKKERREGEKKQEPGWTSILRGIYLNLSRAKTFIEPFYRDTLCLKIISCFVKGHCTIPLSLSLSCAEGKPTRMNGT